MFSGSPWPVDGNLSHRSSTYHPTSSCSSARTCIHAYTHTHTHTHTHTRTYSSLCMKWPKWHCNIYTVFFQALPVVWMSFFCPHACDHLCQGTLMNPPHPLYPSKLITPSSAPPWHFTHSVQGIHTLFTSRRASALCTRAPPLLLSPHAILIVRSHSGCFTPQSSAGVGAGPAERWGSVNEWMNERIIPLLVWEQSLAGLIFVSSKHLTQVMAPDGHSVRISWVVKLRFCTLI